MEKIASDVPENLAVVFGKRVCDLRIRQGLSQPKLAEEIGVTQGAIDHYEKGRNLPNAITLMALADVLETNIDFFLGRTNDDRPPSDLEDQVVVGVANAEERALLQDIMDTLRVAPQSDKIYIRDLIRKLIPKPPRIIGRE